jgi:hypothetical protein
MQDATVDGAGKVVLDVRPPVVVAPADGLVVTLIQPMAYFRMRQNWNPILKDISNPIGGASGITLEFVEILP